MKQRRKANHCLNCGLRIETIYNYCPQCGQENTNNKVSVLELLKDIYDDYITFDSRLVRSLKPFFFSPGKLTNTFNEGKRIDYVHPVRFYLLISLLYFFVFTHVFDFENLSSDVDKNLNKIDSIQTQNLSKVLNDSLQTKLKNSGLDSTTVIDLSKARGDVLLKINKKIKKITKKNNEAKEDKDSIELQKTEAQLAYLEKELDKLEGNPSQVAVYDSIAQELEKIENQYEDPKDNEDDFGGVKVQYDKLKLWLEDKKMTETALLDSMNVKEKGVIATKFAHQLLKIGRNDISIFVQTMVDNIPIMMTLLLPFMALLLKMIYIRSARLYIEHLVFAFHTQSFVYLGLMLSFLAYYFLDYQHTASVITYTSLILSIYIVLMFRNVYKQGWVKTTIKAGILSFAYSIILFIFLVFEVLLSFFLY